MSPDDLTVSFPALYTSTPACFPTLGTLYIIFPRIALVRCVPALDIVYMTSRASSCGVVAAFFINESIFVLCRPFKHFYLTLVLVVVLYWL